VDITEASPPPRAAKHAVSALYAEHALGLVRLAVITTGDQGSAEDIVQDAFLGLYRRWDHLTDTSFPLAYLRASVLHPPLLPRPVRRRDRAHDGNQPRHRQVSHVPCARRGRPHAQGGVMTRTEELVRSTVHGIAGTVTQVGPLRPASADDWISLGTARRLDHGERGQQARRWGNWIAPVAAAAVVIALAASLVVIRERPNHGAGTPAGPVPGVSGLPRYFVKLTGTNGVWSGLLVGDTFSGRKVATVAAPPGLVFTGVSAAADDRTFVVDTTATKPLTGSRTFYLLRVAPGSASPASLTRLPISAVPDATGMALSGSGRELAVTIAGSKDTLRIYSVASGSQLHSWSANSDFGFLHSAGHVVLTDAPGLRWVDGDRAVAFVVTHAVARTPLTTNVRRLDMSVVGNGDLATASRVIFSGGHLESQAGQVRCLGVPLVSGDGKTIICATDRRGPFPAGDPGYPRPTWYAYPAGPPASPRTIYQTTLRVTLGVDGYGIETLWANQSGDTALVEWFANRAPDTIVKLSFGVISHGRFTPLPASNINNPNLNAPPVIAW
jgi:hypothetical protein